MSELIRGTTIELNNGKSCIVGEELGRGGQGIVYRVKYDGGEYALKWYILDYSNDFYNNLKQNAERGAPSPSFLWPIAISTRQRGSFGYIMHLRPDGYKEVGQFMLARARFANVSVLIEAALQICSAFQKLHIQGLSYQDMNDGNFFIHPQTGHVLICDNDNVAPDKIHMGIVGKSGYMAPEIVDKDSLPNRYTDYFSLSVILFILFYYNRPFEGKRFSSCPCITEEAERVLNGKNAVFIMDPSDDSNRPDPKLHRNVLRRWPLFPRFLRETFIKTFNKEAMLDPTKRVMDKTWQKVLLQVRSQYVTCPLCNKNTFVEPSKDNFCIECRNVHPKHLVLKRGSYDIPLYEGQTIYKSLISDSSTDLSDVIGIVVKNTNNGQLGIKNTSSFNWQVRTNIGETRVVNPNMGFPITPDYLIRFSGHRTEDGRIIE